MKSLLLAAIFSPLFARHVVEGGNGAAAPATLLDMNEVLDTSIDNVEDAPEFVIPPDGEYMLEVKDSKLEDYKVTLKDGTEEKRVRLKIIYSVVQTHELSNEEEHRVPAGAMFSEQFMTNPQGLSYFKRQAKNILGEETIKGAVIRDILKELPNNHQFNATVKVKRTKGSGDNAGKTYENVQVRIKGGDPIPATA